VKDRNVYNNSYLVSYSIAQLSQNEMPHWKRTGEVRASIVAELPKAKKSKEMATGDLLDPRSLRRNPNRYGSHGGAKAQRCTKRASVYFTLRASVSP